jgi:hypothetical protein
LPAALLGAVEQEFALGLLWCGRDLFSRWKGEALCSVYIALRAASGSISIRHVDIISEQGLVDHHGMQRLPRTAAVLSKYVRSGLAKSKIVENDLPP